MAGDTGIANQVGSLRMTAIELRDIADHEPSVAVALRHIADQCDREADDLAEHFGVRPLHSP